MPDFDQMYDEAVAIQEAGDLEAAIGKLEELLRQAPEHVLTHSALSVYYGKLERYDEAVQHAERVCELDANDPFSFVALSLICQKAGRIMEAEQAATTARRLQTTGM